jgi:hypothetical protein
MKKIILGVLAVAVSILLVGCGTKPKTDPTKGPPYVSFFSNDGPENTIYFKLTKSQVKNVGSYLGSVSTLPRSTKTSGPGGWDTNMINKSVTIRELSGSKNNKMIPLKSEIFKLTEVSVQYSKNGSYYKAIKQSKEP